jgi:hypothetical protein
MLKKKEGPLDSDSILLTIIEKRAHMPRTVLIMRQKF